MRGACRVPELSGQYCVGAAKREITPAGPVNLGGYGFGPVRRSTGVKSPIYARAIAISRGEQAVVFCATDTQGHFIAYQDGDEYGAADIRRRVSNDAAIGEQDIIVASTHDHSGPDDIGVWGGAPHEYLKFVADQTVAAIESAIGTEEPASLYSAEIDTESSRLLRNMLTGPYPLDTRLRVLFAKDASDATIATLVNFSAHVTVLGEDNTLISPDWPGATVEAIEKGHPDSTALVMVASVGRTQPNLSEIGTRDFQAVKQYGATVATLAFQAEARAAKVDGPIAATETALDEPVENPVLASLTMDGTRGVDRVMRSNRAPYFADGKIRTLIGAVRIGKLFFAAVPGESFPETQIALEARVAAQEHYLFSLAEDQLGYDPPPYEVGVVDLASPLDEGLFIVNPHFGTHVTRTLLTEARQLGFAVSDSGYTGDEGREAQSSMDSVKATIGRVEEKVVRRLMIITLWLGYQKFH